MAMNLKFESGPMTEHDKKLISTIVFVLVVVGLGFFVARPLYQNIQELRTSIQEDELKKETIDQKLSLLPSERSMNTALQQQFAEAQAGFYPMMESSDIDRLLTTLVLSEGLSARNLNIAMPAGMTNITPYPYSDAATLGDTGEDTASELYAATVSLTVTGGRTGMENLLERLYSDEYKDVRIVSYSWDGAVTPATAVDADGNPIATEAGDEIMSLSLEVYMCKTATQAAD